MEECNLYSFSFMINTYATSIFPSGFLVAPVTLVFSLNLSPCFCRMRWKFLEISMSIPIPPTWPVNSTAVTSAPRRCQTDPCSHNNIRKGREGFERKISCFFTAVFTTNSKLCKRGSKHYSKLISLYKHSVG